jgi:hypothetical protein
MIKSWRRFNNAIHRDIGYLFFGMAVIYGLSGIALNHINDWDPSYIITKEEIKFEAASLGDDLNETQVKSILDEFVPGFIYKKHYYPTEDVMKVFISGGSVTINTNSGLGILEHVRKRPVFFEVNYLHYNNAGALWTWFSDIFSGGLIIMAITGLFVLRGKNSFRKRGIWFVSVGIIIPLIFLLLYYFGH